MIPWQCRARALADEIEAAGELRDPAWRAALEDVPRHVFVPRFYVQQPNMTWAETSEATPGWLDAVYRNEPLITELAKTGDGSRVVVSSSSKPGLMVRMLESLNLRDGDRVLEIGTGTGYNAALLAHRLDDSQVFSVDIGAKLVRTAADRLAALGYTPTLIEGDGARGAGAHAPFDRIIATCSVPAVPPAWTSQLREHGLLLVDLKRSNDAGNLVLLRKRDDRLVGRFLPKWAAFMRIRKDDAAPEFGDIGPGEGLPGTRSRTGLSPYPWSAPIPWFLAQAGYPSEARFGLRGITEDGPQWTALRTADGSWARIRLAPDEDGRRETRQGGPVRLWDAFERAHQEWVELGSPDWRRFGLTVEPDGRHTVWLDQPAGPHSWALP